MPRAEVEVIHEELEPNIDDEMTRRGLFRLGLVAASVLVAACGEEEQEPVDLGLAADPDKKMRAARITSTFENSDPELHYDYVRDANHPEDDEGLPNDGRGITAGRAGNTSRDDLLEVVRPYAEQRPDSELAAYVEALEEVKGTSSTEGLEGFVDAWRSASQNDPLLNQIQDEVVDRVYFYPAMEWAKQAGIKSSLGQEIIWDAIIQQGEGDPEEEKDGLPSMMIEVLDAIGPVQGNEAEWLRTFLDVRKEHLSNAANEYTRAAWRKTTSRVDALRSILDTGNLALEPPLEWEVYGGHYELTE